MSDEIVVCDSCKNMPLVWTFAFNGAEYWCPYCGKTFGCFGRDRVKSTPKLEEKLWLYEKYSRKYLSAKSSQVCCERKINGKWVKQEDIPVKFKTRMAKIVKEYKYRMTVKKIKELT